MLSSRSILIRWRLVASLGIGFALLGLGSFSRRPTDTHPVVKTPIRSNTYPPVAVLELFTSQGCSSCPSADQLLTETLADAARSDKRIFGLSFHVDYWDRLGWKDPFSDHAFTQRQYNYSERFGQHGVYTPQVVLNGQQEFIGSNRVAQRSGLTTALSTPANTAVQLTTSGPKNNQLTVAYRLTGDLSEAILNVALVSKSTKTAVREGENAGRQLGHTNVVRAFQTVPAAAQGTISLPLPPDFQLSNGAVVAYVQARKTWVVRGASQLNL